MRGWPFWVLVTGFSDGQFDGSCGNSWVVLRYNCEGGVEEKERGKQGNDGK